MITSTSNPQVKNLLQLQKKSKVRNEEQVFIVEGLRMFMEVPQDQVKKVYVSESLYNKKKEELHLERFPVEVLADKVFQHVSDTKTPQGILCVVKQRKYEIEDLISKENPHFIVLDNLQDPGNLGTIVRTAEGAGVTAVFMSNDCVDIYIRRQFALQWDRFIVCRLCMWMICWRFWINFKRKRSQLMRRILREKILMTRRIISQGQQFSLEMREMD